jgi:hypothetical protein
MYLAQASLIEMGCKIKECLEAWCRLALNAILLPRLISIWTVGSGHIYLRVVSLVKQALLSRINWLIGSDRSSASKSHGSSNSLKFQLWDMVSVKRSSGVEIG